MSALKAAALLKVVLKLTTLLTFQLLTSELNIAALANAPSSVVTPLGIWVGT
jgi:hypothetical protein